MKEGRLDKDERGWCRCGVIVEESARVLAVALVSPGQ
jgi:hypothetical protein